MPCFTKPVATPYYITATYGGKIAAGSNFPADYFVSSEKVSIFAAEFSCTCAGGHGSRHGGAGGGRLQDIVE